MFEDLELAPKIDVIPEKETVEVEETPKPKAKVKIQPIVAGDAVEVIHGEDAPKDGWKSPLAIINNRRGYRVIRVTADGKSAFLAKPFNCFVPIGRLRKK